MPRKTTGARKISRNLPPDVAAIVAKLEEFLDVRDDQNRRWCDAKCGVYAFYDYDREPIHVGQTVERLRVRIRRHMTNQRTDAVAMRVLDPLEVAEVAVWPYWEFDLLSLMKQDNKERVAATLNAAEYTLFQQVMQESSIKSVLNEKIPAETDLVDLPPGYRARIVSDELWDRLSHLDERIARRALKLSELAQVIRQRDVSVGLRRTLSTQADRMLLLSQRRFSEIAGVLSPLELEEQFYGAEEREERNEGSAKAARRRASSSTSSGMPCFSSHSHKINHCQPAAARSRRCCWSLATLRAIFLSQYS